MIKYNIDEKMMKKIKCKFYALTVLFALALVLWCALIYSFSAQTGTESAGISNKIVDGLIELISDEPNENVDAEHDLLRSRLSLFVRKTAHFSEYAVLGILAFFLIAALLGSGQYKIVISAISVSFCVIFAIFDELHQLFINGRVGSALDVLIDTVGALFGATLALLLYTFILRKRNKSREK